MTHLQKVVVLVGVGLIAVLLAGLAAAQDGQVVTIAGMIQGTNEDDDGNPQSVYLYDENLGPILVGDNDKGRELLQLVDTQVTVTGPLSAYEGPVESFSMVIQVTSYTRLGEDDESDESEDTDVDPG